LGAFGRGVRAWEGVSVSRGAWRQLDRAVLRRFLTFKKRQCFSRVVFPQKTPRDFEQGKRRASFCETARRSIRFFCPKSHTGTAEGVPTPFAAGDRKSFGDS
jgi:hypothetical protein